MGVGIYNLLSPVSAAALLQTRLLALLKLQDIVAAVRCPYE